MVKVSHVDTFTSTFRYVFHKSINSRHAPLICACPDGGQEGSRQKHRISPVRAGNGVRIAGDVLRVLGAAHECPKINLKEVSS
jgi:hypothetical protein